MSTVLPIVNETHGRGRPLLAAAADPGADHPAEIDSLFIITHPCSSSAELTDELLGVGKASLEDASSGLGVVVVVSRDVLALVSLVQSGCETVNGPEPVIPAARRSSTPAPNAVPTATAAHTCLRPARRAHSPDTPTRGC